MSLAAAASSDAAGFQPDEGGSQPTPLLHFFDLPSNWTDRWEVRPISQATAARWCGQYHYSGNAGPENGTFWGFYLGDLACVVGFSNGANEHGLVKKFDLTRWPSHVEICRVACHPDAPRNTASRAVAAVLRTVQAPLGTPWVFSYADTGQGHHGGIYQALRAVYLVDGVPVHPRTMINRFGSRAAAFVAGLPNVQIVDGLNTPKHTYILPIGPAADAIRRHLAPFALPYPKRTAA